MDCVYHAYTRHMRYLDIEVDTVDRLWYNLLKRITHGSEPQFTWGGVIPWIIRKLANRHGCIVKIQHRIWLPPHYEADATNWMQRTIVKHTDFGEEGDITLAPAIYLMLHAQHAEFATRVPKRLVVMALQIQKREKNDDRRNARD